MQLLDCFDALLDVGHSLIVVEHNLQLMKAADYIIDLGPGAADEGGRVVAQGTPEAVARAKESVTGRFLAKALAEKQQGGAELLCDRRGGLTLRMHQLTDFADRLEIFVGEATDGRVPRLRSMVGGDAEGHATLSGSLTGSDVPVRRDAAGDVRVRRSRAGRVAAGRGDRARACFWTPEMPHLYRGRVAIAHEATTVLAEAAGCFGIRRAGCAGPELDLATANAGCCAACAERARRRSDLSHWHEASAAMMVLDPERCSVRSSQSRRRAAGGRAGRGRTAAEIAPAEPLAGGRRWSLLPAAMPTASADARAHNLLLAERFATGTSR